MPMLRNLTIAALVMGLAACGNAGSDSRNAAPRVSTQQEIPQSMRGVEARQLFGAAPAGSGQQSEPIGGYAKGCLAGGVQLAETGPTWQAMRLSRNRNWGHPEAIDFIQKLGAKAAQQPGWNGLYVGDISQPRGGPMLTGHRSHQNGMDLDIWMLPASRLNLSRQERENLSSISLRRANGAYVNDNWTKAHHEIMKAAAQDPRVERIFVFPGAKVQMCEDETGDRAYLRKIRPWWPARAAHAIASRRIPSPPGMAAPMPNSGSAIS